MSYSKSFSVLADIDIERIQRMSLSLTLLESEGESSTFTSGSEFRFIGKEHPKELLQSLHQLREEGTFCDVTLECQSQLFPCHKSVLSSFSNYFKAMFTSNMAECSDKVVKMNGVEADMLAIILNFGYTAEALITRANVQALMTNANMLQVVTLEHACAVFMEHNMDDNNCIGVHCFAERLDCKELADKAKSYTLQHFTEIYRTDEFLSLTRDKLVELVQDNELRVDDEECVFEAVKGWLEHDREGRSKDLHQVVGHVRLGLLSPYYLHDCVESLDFIQQSEECMALVNEAKTFQLLKDRQLCLENERSRHRLSAGIREYMIAVGGEDDKVVLRSVESYNTQRQQWKTLSCLPFAISKHGLAISGSNFMYMAGGEFPDGTASRAVWRYELALDVWLEVTPMSMPRSELGLAFLDGYLYAVGGWEGSNRLDSVERYSPITNEWEFVSPMTMALTSAAVVAYNGLMYVTGGAVLEDGDGIDLVQCYNPRTDTWKVLPSMLIPRSGSVACILNGSLYVIGGWHASTENTSKVERFNLKGQVWESRSAMCERRYRPGAAVINGKIYVCGGEEGWDRYHDTIECYDELTNTWSLVGELPTSRSWHSCVAVRMREEWLHKNDKISCIV